MEDIKIFLVDDHLIFREGLRNLIELEGVGKIVDEASNGKEFLEKLENANPDLVLMDISMPEIRITSYNVCYTKLLRNC